MCGAAAELLGSLRCGLRLAAAAAAKLLLEAAVQRAYYALQGVGEAEALARVRARSRAAASFTATMIRRLRGVHGSRKAWILRVYLRVAELVHPSARLHEAGGPAAPPEELLREVVDAVLYLEALCGAPLDPEHPAVTRCRPERTLRLLLRRGSRGARGP